MHACRPFRSACRSFRSPWRRSIAGELILRLMIVDVVLCVRRSIGAGMSSVHRCCTSPCWPAKRLHARHGHSFLALVSVCVLSSLSLPLTSLLSRQRASLTLPCGDDLIGHGMGGVARVSWLLLHSAVAPPRYLEHRFPLSPQPRPQASPLLSRVPSEGPEAHWGRHPAID